MDNQLTIGEAVQFNSPQRHGKELLTELAIVIPAGFKPESMKEEQIITE